MKCKKLFALLLSLCMVLSTFVAVSAAEQEFVPGNVKTIVDMTTADAKMQNGSGMSTATFTTIDGVEAYGGACDGGSYGYFGFQLVDPNGIPVKLYAGDVVTIEADIWHENGFSIMSGKTTQGIILRAGDAWAPSGAQYYNVAKTGAVPAATWTTVDSTYTITENYTSKYVYLQVRPNKAGATYVANLKITVKGARKADVALNYTMDNEATGGLEKGSQVTSLTYADGVATAVLTGTGNDSMVGVRLVKADGTDFIPKTGDVINYSVRINPSETFTAGSSTTGLLMRNGSSYPPSESPFYGIHSQSNIPANEWTTLSGSWICNQDYVKTTYLNIRPSKAMTLKVDHIIININETSDTAVQDAWVTPDGVIDLTLSNGGSSAVVSADGNSATLAMADVMTSYNKSAEGVNDTTCWLRVNTSEAVASTANWKLTYDVTVSGHLSDTDGATSTRARLLDSLTSAFLSNTYYFASTAVPTEEGTVSVELTPLNNDRDGNLSDGDFISMGICYNFAQSCEKYNEETDADTTVTFSNFRLVVSDPKVTPSVDKDDTSVTLTLTNDNANTFKVTGNLFVAAYDGNEMMKFGKAAVNEELDAGDSAEVTVDMGSLAGKTVRVFFWEADGTLTPIKDWTL